MRALSLVACLAVTVPAAATVYIPADFAEMVGGSAFIVHGTIAEVRSEASADRRSIATYVTVDVEQTLKGRLGESVTFRVPGGQVGRYRRIVVGAPQFERGDEVVLFLSARGPSFPFVFGLSQGVYRVSRASGRAIGTPAAIGAQGIGPERVVRGDPARRALALEACAREVRAAMERGR
jgi:hypothetical protein